MAVAMASWSELERRFEELQPALRGARLDCQQDDYGDRWHLAASDTLARAKFEMLSRIAGDKLTRLASKTQMAPEILAAPDALTRWYRFLASRFYKHYSVYQYNDSEGKATESWGSLGSIDDPAGAAAYHYLQLSPSDDDERDRPIAMTTILTGHNSRLNVNSVDNSTNAVTVTAPTPTVFDELIAAIHDAESLSRKQRLLSKALSRCGMRSARRRLASAKRHLCHFSAITCRFGGRLWRRIWRRSPYSLRNT